MRRALGVGVLALLLTATSVAMAAPPAGPRLAAIKASPNARSLELVSFGPNGGNALRLAGGGRRSRPYLDSFSPLSWSADGAEIAFGGVVGFEKGDDHEPIRKIFMVGADGGGLRPIAGTKGATGPVLSPDGRTLAFTRRVERQEPTTVGGKAWEEGFNGSSIWLMDLATGTQRQLTPWQDEVGYTASSFSPDGSNLLATHEDGLLLREQEPVVLSLDGNGGSRRLLDDGFSPVYSPDGSQVALVRNVEEYGKQKGENTDVFVVNADGSGVRRLTRTSKRVEFFPSWDPSGQRLAYVRFPVSRFEDEPFGARNALVQINADGSCQTTAVSLRLTYFFVPTWQPGPDRGAGRIEC